MEKKYRITEVARFFKVSRQTLIYYDKIGLFKPDKINDENSYRMYSPQQFSNLRFILTLKSLEFSLDEIKNYVQSDGRQEGLEFLEEKSGILGRKIEEFIASKKEIDKKIEETKKLIISNKDLPFIKSVKPIKVVLIKVKDPYNNLSFEKTLLSAKKLGEKFSFKDKKYLITVAMENLKKESYLYTSYLGLILPDTFTHRDEKFLTGGEIATIIHRGTLKSIDSSYTKLKRYIDQEGYEIIGDSREVHNQNFVYLGDGPGTTVEIQIPVKSFH